MKAILPGAFVPRPEDREAERRAERLDSAFQPEAVPR